VLDGGSADAHGVGPAVQPLLHGVDHRLMLPALDAALLAARTPALQRAAGAFGRPVDVEVHAVLDRGEAADEAPDHLIRDRDASYGSAVTKRLAAMGIRDHPIAPRSPWQSGHAERLIGSMRRECLDHIVVFGEAHLRRILAAYAGYYNRVRTHLSLGKDSPGHRPVHGSANSLLSRSSADFIINTAGFSSR
jgi:transposase InsO family protein